MGFRFRKTFKIAPGVRLNLSKKGTSWTLGGRGAAVNVGGRSGPKATVGVPGTGISFTQSLSSSAGAQEPDRRSSTRFATLVLYAAAGILILWALSRCAL